MQASISDHVKALLGTSYPIVHVVDVQDTHAERAASEQSCGQPTGGWFAQPRCKEYSTFKLAGRGAIHKEVKTNHIECNTVRRHNLQKVCIRHRHRGFDTLKMNS